MANSIFKSILFFELVVDLYTMKVSISVMWIFRVGLAYVFVKVLGGGIETVWYAMFIDWVARAFIYRNVGITE